MSRDLIDDDVVVAAIERAKVAIDKVLRGYRRRRALDQTDAEEISSEVQVALLTRLGQAGAAGIEVLEAYATRTTRNLVVSLFRRRDAEALVPMPEDEFPDRRPLGQTAAEQRLDLERIWRRIERMPPQHRAALLLGMRTDDGTSGASLLTFLDVTSMEALAAAIGVSRVELEESLWSELPLDDVRIGAMLGMKTRKVTDLRRSARRSLISTFKR